MKRINEDGVLAHLVEREFRVLISQKLERHGKAERVRYTPQKKILNQIWKYGF